MINKNGRKYAFLLRLSPLVPFNILNYLLGLNSISGSDNLIGCLGMLPGTIVYVYLGASLQSIADISSAGKWSDNTSTIILMISGTIISVAGIIWISLKAKK